MVGDCFSRGFPNSGLALEWHEQWGLGRGRESRKRVRGKRGRRQL